MPCRCKESVVCSIHQKENRTPYENYRYITLMDVVIMFAAIKNRLNEIVERKQGKYQYGFRESKSVVDQVFKLK